MFKYHRGESFIHFTYFEAIPCENQEKPGGGLSPSGENQNRNQFVFLSFGVKPLNWQSFIEIGEVACSTTAGYFRGHSLNIRVSLLLLSPEPTFCFHVFGLKETDFHQNQLVYRQPAFHDTPAQILMNLLTRRCNADYLLECSPFPGPCWLFLGCEGRPDHL